MNLLGSLFTSSIGRKFLMALTGLVLFGFVTGHLVGNLQIFLPPEKINHYGLLLESLGGGLWAIRLFLLACVAIHVWLAIQLTLENRAARPESYLGEKTNRATLASRVMARTGLIVLAFLIYHLAHFTVRAGHPEWSEHTYKLADGTMVRDVYRMVVEGFSNGWVSLFYIVSVGLLSFHLVHGIVSMFQSLGLKNETWTRNLEIFAKIYCVGYFVLNALIPLSILGYVPVLSGLIQR
ncbi:MAG: succinate dehydrogenase cytochrome b subunit [Candidatus Didemnitutus sp.]|nr:succinate dehydrogenase cytochrome b subunit [Candidatus Didemnitutus sp.]